ncbi:MAG: hypothetical protein IT428_22915 [Planctomycetaceae bacterium]|nr:hypothetical protein [Planctomycetaceae bacterium]
MPPPFVAFLPMCVAIVLTGTTAASESGASEPARIETLIEQLGAPSYERRVEAGKALRAIGLPGLRALRRAARSDNLEVAERVRRILADVERIEQERRVEEYLKDPVGAPDDLLPGLKRYRAAVGNGAEHAGLFVAMQRAEPTLFRAAETSVEALEAAYAGRCSEMFVEYNLLQSRRQIVERTAAILFCGAEPDLKDDAQVEQFVSQFVHWNEFRTALPSNPALKRVLGQWIAKDGTTLSHQKVMIGLNYDIPECIHPAVAMCRAGAALGMQQYAMLAVARFGNVAHVPVLETSLRNTAVIGPTAQNKKTTWESRVQDFALAALIQVTGQDPKDYHFKRLEKNPQFVFSPNTIGFTSADDRDAALRKWREWRAKPAVAETP